VVRELFEPDRGAAREAVVEGDDEDDLLLIELDDGSLPVPWRRAHRQVRRTAFDRFLQRLGRGVLVEDERDPGVLAAPAGVQRSAGSARGFSAR
jgi:hypothetical protein